MQEGCRRMASVSETDAGLMSRLCIPHGAPSKGWLSTGIHFARILHSNDPVCCELWAVSCELWVAGSELSLESTVSGEKSLLEQKWGPRRLQCAVCKVTLKEREHTSSIQDKCHLNEQANRVTRARELHFGWKVNSTGPDLSLCLVTLLVPVLADAWKEWREKTKGKRERGKEWKRLRHTARSIALTREWLLLVLVSLALLLSLSLLVALHVHLLLFLCNCTGGKSRTHRQLVLSHNCNEWTREAKCSQRKGRGKVREKERKREREREREEKAKNPWERVEEKEWERKEWKIGWSVDASMAKMAQW